MFNSGFRGKRASDGTGVVNPQDKFIQGAYPVPTINSWTISGSDDDALDPAGGQTVLVNGGGLVAGCAVTVNGVTISPVTIVNSNQISFTSPALAGGSYSLIVYNSAGGAAILVPGLIYSSVPTWTTSAGSIGTYYETTAIDEALVATSDSSITYSLTSGSLPIGSTLYANGVITGTSPVDSSSTTYTFGVTATDAEDQDVTRTFTLTINTDVVTWVTPSSGATILLDGTSYSQVLTATDAASYAVSYSANTLPTGLSLSSGTISGTPTVDGTTSTLLTATAATTNRSATNTITWVVSLSDAYWKNVALLLGGSTPSPTFINDASLNNSQLTIVGDTKPTKFSPYSNGYYSNYCDGTGDYLNFTTANTTLGTNNFTIEFWFNRVAYGGAYDILTNLAYSTNNGPYTAIQIQQGSSGGTFLVGNGSNAWAVNIGITAPPVGTWAHYVLVRSGNTFSAYINGVRQGNATSTVSIPALAAGIQIGYTYYGAVSTTNGYFSNYRVLNGTAAYDPSATTISVPTAPFTATADTVLLTCQSSRFIDNSTRYSVPTVAGNIAISSAYPFSSPTASSYNTLYSMYFDGTGDYLTTAGNTALDMGTGDFTIECFVNTNGYAGSQYGRGMFALYPSGNYNNRLIVRHTTADNRLNFYGAAGGNPYLGTSGTDGTTALVVGTWNHIAVVRQSGVFRLYINGVQDIVISNQTGISLASSNCFDIGRTQEGSVPDWNGVISNFRVIKGTCLYPNGTTFTKPTSTLTAVAGTSLLTCQDSTVKDNSSNAIVITVGNQAQPVAVSPFTMTTSSTTVTSLGSAYFDGTGDYLSIPNSAAFNLPGDFTMEAWVYPTSYPGSNNTVISMWTAGLSFIFKVVSGNRISFYGYPGSTIGVVASSTTVDLNRWSHVAATRVGSTVRLYVNGVQDAASVTMAGTLAGTTDTLNVGSLGTIELWNGYITDARIVKGTALYTSNFLPPQAPLIPVTNTQLLTLQYNGGANNNGIIDQSSFNNNLTRFGNTTQGTFSPYSQTGWSNYFNGSTDYLQLANNPAFDQNGSFTFECWVYPTSLSGNDKYMYSQLVSGYLCFAINTSGKFIVDKSYIGVQITSTSTYTANNWYHYAVSCDGTTTRLFVNGAAQGSATTTGVASGAVGTIGFYNTNYFSGYISNMRWVKGTALYTTAFTPSTVPLTPISKTVLLTCQSNQLVDTSANSFTITRYGTPSVQAYSPFGGVTSVPTSYSTQFISGTTYLRTNNNTNTVPGTGDFTVEGWFYLTSSVSANQAMFNLGAYDNGILLRANSSGFDVWINNVQVYNAVGSGSYTINAWYHIALTRQGTNLRLFLNGTQLGTTASNNANITSSSAPNYLLGNSAHAASSDIMVGYMSNWRVIKGQALFTGSFTPSTAPLTTTTVGATGAGAAASITGTVELLTMQSSTIVDNSYNNATITATGTLLQKAFNPFGNTTSTLVAYDPSVHGGSIYMDGTGDYLTAPNSKSFDLSAGKWTIECWFYQLAPKQAQLFSISAALWRLAVSTDGSAGFTFNTSSTTSYPAGSFPARQWNHISASFNDDGTNSGQRSHANGKLVATGQYIPGADTTSLFYVGNNKDASGSWDFNGYISDIRITKGECLYYSSFVPSFTALPKTKNTAFLLNGTSGGIVDAHSSNNLETVGNTQLASEDPYSGTYYSLALSSSGYLTTPANAAFDLATASASFTLEAWVYFNAYNSMASSAAVIAGNFLTSNGWFWGWYGVNTIQYLTLTVYPSGTAANFTMDTTTIPLGKWIHVATVNNAGTLTTYINGVSVGGTQSYAGYTGSGGQLAIGVYQQNLGYSGNPDWLISNLRITKGQALYTSAFTPSTTPLTTTSQSATAANVSLLTGQSNSFKDNSNNNFTLTRNTAGSIKSKNPFQQNTGKSLYFDGNGDYLQFTETPGIWYLGPSDFTIEAWVYISVTNSSEAYIIARSQHGVGSDWFFGFSSTNQLRLYMSTGGSNIVTSTGTVKVGEWTHVAATRSGTSFKLYINGNIDGTLTSSVVLGTSYGPTVVSNASNNTGSHYLNGYITDLRITKGVARTIAVPTTPYKTN